MGRRVIEVFPSRWLLLGGAVMMSIFAVAAFVFRRVSVNEDSLSLVAGVLSYGFIAYALLVAFLAWKGRSVRRAHMTARAFAEQHVDIGRSLGEPVRVYLRPGRMERTDDNGVRVQADLGGILGEGDITVTLHPGGDDWRVTAARFADDAGEHDLAVEWARR